MNAVESPKSTEFPGRLSAQSYHLAVVTEWCRRPRAGERSSFAQ